MQVEENLMLQPWDEASILVHAIVVTWTVSPPDWYQCCSESKYNISFLPLSSVLFVWGLAEKTEKKNVHGEKQSSLPAISHRLKYSHGCLRCGGMKGASPQPPVFSQSAAPQVKNGTLPQVSQVCLGVEIDSWLRLMYRVKLGLLIRNQCPAASSTESLLCAVSHFDHLLCSDSWSLSATTNICSAQTAAIGWWLMHLLAVQKFRKIYQDVQMWAELAPKLLLLSLYLFICNQD